MTFTLMILRINFIVSWTDLMILKINFTVSWTDLIILPTQIAFYLSLHYLSHSIILIHLMMMKVLRLKIFFLSS